MGDIFEYVSVGCLLEAYIFIEALGIFLSLNIYASCIENLYCCVNGMNHYLLAITLATLGCYDSSYGDFWKMSSRRA